GAFWATTSAAPSGATSRAASGCRWGPPSASAPASSRPGLTLAGNPPRMLAEATIATAISVPARRAHRPPGRGHPTPDQAGGGAAPAAPSPEPPAVLGPH